MLMTTLARVLLIATVMPGAGPAAGQNYPTKFIRVFAGNLGGGADALARYIAQGISGPLGQQVIVDNRGGAIMSAQIVAKAPPDGYTLLFFGSSFWVQPLLQSTPYDPVRDFSPIALVATAPNILVVHPSLPVKSVRDLIALAKARPGALNYGAGSPGTGAHLASALFSHMAGVNIVAVHYKGLGASLTATISGEVQVTFATTAAVLPHIKSGRLRALAVTSAGPSALAPGLPPVAASGLPGYESASRHAVFAPAITPAPIINRLNVEFVRFLNMDKVKEWFLDAATEAVGSSPEQLAATMKSEMARLGKLVKEAGIRAD